MGASLGRRTLLAGMTAVPVAAGLGAIGGGRPAAAAGGVSAVPDKEITGLLNAYSDSGAGWVGADSTYSVRLPDGRQVWIFSDTLLGPVGPGGTLPKTAPFINNSFVVQRGRSLTTVHGGTAARPAALVEPAGVPPGSAWYWAGAGMLGPGTLDVTYHQFHKTGGGPLDFAWQASVLVRFSLHDLTVLDVTPLPSAVPNLESASWLETVGGYTYIYRVEDQGLDKYLHVARVRGRDLRRGWEFFTGGGWSPDQHASARVLHGVGNEYSVTRYRGGYVLITQDTSEYLSSHIVAYFASSPTGPFTAKTQVYTTPETGANGSYHNGNVYTYNPHVHSELSTADRLVVSYNVNSLHPDDLYGDISIYRPRFLDVRLGSRP